MPLVEANHAAVWRVVKFGEGLILVFDIEDPRAFDRRRLIR